MYKKSSGIFMFAAFLAFALLVMYLFIDMRFHYVLALAAAFGNSASGQKTQYTSTAVFTAVEAAKATALTLSPVSSIKGKRFDRFVNIFLENTDYDMAAGDRKSDHHRQFSKQAHQIVKHPSKHSWLKALH